MQKIYPIAFAFFFLISACSPNKIEQGEISYTVTYPHANVSGFVMSLLPDKMSLVFKGTKVMTTIKRGKIFTTQIITDEADHSIEMRLIFGNEHAIYTVLKPADIDNLRNTQPDYQITPTEDTDSLGGLFGKRYTVTCASDTVVNEDAWFSEDLAPQDAYWFTSYSSIKGVPLEYDFERYGVFMRIEINKFDKKEIKDSAFERDKKLTEVSFTEYEAIAQELFDALMK